MDSNAGRSPERRQDRGDQFGGALPEMRIRLWAAGFLCKFHGLAIRVDVVAARTTPAQVLLESTPDALLEITVKVRHQEVAAIAAIDRPTGFEPGQKVSEFSWRTGGQADLLFSSDRPETYCRAIHAEPDEPGAI